MCDQRIDDLESAENMRRRQEGKEPLVLTPSPAPLRADLVAAVAACEAAVRFLDEAYSRGLRKP